MISAGLVFAAAAGLADAEPAPPPVDVGVVYIGDVVGALDGGLARKARYLDNGNLTLDADLARLVGWTGGVVHVDVLYNGGGTPNDDVGTLQGVDNIEVSRQRVRLFEAWIEQSFGDGVASLKLGLYDLNSEFYSTDAAGTLIAPAFGIGSEIAATGPNGPSIFPSTALAARLNVNFGGDAYARFAALNANAGVIGDPGGVDTSFNNGALLIAETGMRGARTLAVGAWRYTRRQDDLRELVAPGVPQLEIAQGAYALAEQPLNDPEGTRATAVFARVGVSEGETTPFKGGWQAGVTVSRVFESRPDSVFSFGVNQGVVSDAWRLNLIDAGAPASRSEFQLEATYVDRLLPHVTLQPDLQYVINPSADRSIGDALVAALRVAIEF